MNFVFVNAEEDVCIQPSTIRVVLVAPDGAELLSVPLDALLGINPSNPGESLDFRNRVIAGYKRLQDRARNDLARRIGAARDDNR